MEASSREAADALGLQRIGHRLKVLVELENHERGADWDLALPGSALAQDDLAAKPYQVSHQVGHCLAMSLDALLGARLVLQDPIDANRVRLLMAAPYPMLRTAMEAGALAMWILLPTDGNDRLARLFRTRWDDIVNDDNLALAFTAPQLSDLPEDISRNNRLRRENAKHVRRLKAALRQVSDAAGVSRSTVELGLPGFGTLMAETASATGIGANQAHAIWRTVSGLTHPSASRSIAFSSIDLRDSAEAGVSRASITASPVLLNSAIEAGLLLHWNTLQRVAELGGNHAVEFKLPEGFPLPPSAG